MTLAANKLQERGCLARWWWLDPAHAVEKCEAALAWESLRRTKSYPAVWRKFREESVPLLKLAEKPTLAGAFQKMQFIQHARESVGQPYFDFLAQGFDPALSWVELAKEQRLLAKGFVVGENAALKMNSELLLTRQAAGRPGMTLAIVDLGYNASGELVLTKEVNGGFGVRRIAGTDFFRGLRVSAPGRYVCVFFDTRGARDALLAAFDQELQKWHRDWVTVMREVGKLAVLWNPNDGTPVEYWEPSSRSTGIRVKQSEVALIPSAEPGYAILLVCARHNPATVRAALHTRMKTGEFKKWHSRCVDYWKTLVIKIPQLARNGDGSVAVDGNGRPIYRNVARPLFNPARDLPSATKQAKSGRRVDLWLGLAANDAVAAGVGLGKRGVAGDVLLKHCASVSALWNHQRSAARRLAELDRAGGQLEQILDACNKKNAKLAAVGFFGVAAGGEAGGPKP